MFVIASIFSYAAAGVGFMAASIAVGGFIAHVRPTLARQGDRELRFATVVGGLCGLVIAILVIGVSGLVE
jgi:hypothetical protein